jgi:hypothetical protein
MKNEVQEVVEDTKTYVNIYTKLIAVQGEIGRIEKTGTNPAFGGSRYAKLEEILSIALPLLRSQGIMSSHIVNMLDNPIQGEDYIIPATLEVTLIDSTTCEQRISNFPLIIRFESAKLDKYGNPVKPANPMQLLGGALTYAHRYGILLALGVTADIDQDGNTPNQNEVTVYNKKENTKTAKPIAKTTPIAIESLTKEITKEDMDSLIEKICELFDMKLEFAYESDRGRATTIESCIKNNFIETNSLGVEAPVSYAILQRRFEWLKTL